MGYANYVGRVGALAVALGIGAAVVTGAPGVAWAGPDTTNEGPSVDEKTNAPEGSNDSTKPSKPGDTLKKNIDRAADEVRHVINSVVTSTGGAIKSELRHAADQVKGSTTTAISPTRPKPRVKDFLSDFTDDEPSQTPTPSSGQLNTPPRFPKAVVDLATPRPVVNVLDKIKDVTEDSVTAFTGDRRTIQAKIADQKDISSVTASMTEARVTPVITRAPLGVLTNVLSAALAPFIGAGQPGHPQPPNPVLWAVLGWVRRELFNDSPTITAPAQDQVSTSLDGRSVTGFLDPQDDDADTGALTYSAAGLSPGATIDFNEDDGTYTYTAPDGWDGESEYTDDITISVSDADTGPHLHGLFGFLGPDSGHTTTIPVKVTLAPLDESPVQEVGDPVLQTDGSYVVTLKVKDGYTPEVDRATAKYGSVRIDPVTDPVTGETTYEIHYTPTLAGELAAGEDGVTTETFSIRFTQDLQASTATEVSAISTFASFARLADQCGADCQTVTFQVAPKYINAGTPITVGSQPGAAVFDEDGNAYVVNTTAGTVTVLDHNNRVIETATVGGSPSNAAVANGKLYVSKPLDGTVSTYDLDGLTDGDDQTNGFVESIDIGTPGGGLMPIAASSDGSHVYVLRQGEGTVWSINTATDAVVDDQSITDAYALATSTSGDRLYVLAPGSSASQTNVWVVDTTDDQLNLVDTQPATVDVAEPISVAGGASAIAANGDRIYLTTGSSVQELDATTFEVGNPIDVDATPINVTISPDGTLAYIGTTEGKVVVVDTATGSVVTTVTVDQHPESGGAYFVSVSPEDGTRLLVSSSSSGIVTPLAIRADKQPPPVVGNHTITNVEVGQVDQANEGAAEALDGHTVVTETGATVTYHYDPATNTLTADVTPTDANRLGGFANPQAPTGFSAFRSMRMTSLAAAAPTQDGVEHITVTVGTQTFNVDVPVTSARLQTGAPITVGGAPGGMTSSGNYLYVVNQQPSTDPVTGEGKYTVTVIDTRTNQPVKDIETGQAFGITSSGDRVYVGNFDGSVTVIDATTNSVVDPITLDRRPQGSPFGLIASEDGKRLYVANADGTVSVVDTATNELVDTKPAPTADPADPEADIDPIGVGGFPYGMALVGNRLYVTDPTTNTVKVMNVDEASPTYGQQVGAPITMGGFPEGIAAARAPGATHDELYVVNARDNTVSIIDTSTNQVVKTIPVATTPTSVVVSPDGSLVYVASAESMTVIDTATRTAILTTRTDATPDDYPTMIALSSDGSRVYVSDALKAYDPAHGIVVYNNTVVPISFVTGGDLNAPTAAVGTHPVLDHTSGAVTTTLTADDVDGDALSISATQPANGTVKVTPNADGTYAVTYTPNGRARLDAFGAADEQKDQFVVTVTDGQKTTAIPVSVTIDPADVAVTDSFGSGTGLHLVRGMTVAPNGDVLVTYMNLPTGGGTPVISVYNATTQDFVDDDVYTADGFIGVNQFAEDIAVDDNGSTYVANPHTGNVNVYNGVATPTEVSVGGTPVGLFTDSDGNVYALVREQYDPNPADEIDESQTRIAVFDVSNNVRIGAAYDTEWDNDTNDMTEGAVGKNGRIYVTNPGSTTVTVIDAANPTGPIDVGGTPVSIAYNKQTERTYVTVVKSSDEDPDVYTVSVVDITDGSGGTTWEAYTIPTGTGYSTAEQAAKLSDMAVSPDGSHIYITNIAASTVTVMNATGPNAGTVDETVAIPKNAIFGGGGPLRIAFSPNGDHAYLVDQTGIFTELSFADTDTNL